MSALRTLLSASIVLTFGCGGSTSTAPSPDGSAEGTGESGSGSGSSGSGSGSDDSGGSGSSDDGGSPGTPGTDGATLLPANDSGTSSDAGGVMTPLKGTDGGIDQIACGGSAPYDSATDVCCVTNKGAACTKTSDCNGDSLACSGTNSCATSEAGAGTICCGAGFGGNHASSSCESACKRNDFQLCTTNADCTTPGDICRRLQGTNLAGCGKPEMPRDGGLGMMRGDGG